MCHVGMPDTNRNLQMSGSEDMYKLVLPRGQAGLIFPHELGHGLLSRLVL